MPEVRLLNPCLGPLPDRLARHEIVRAAFADLDPADVWDCHVHLAGTGDSAQGVWMSPRMRSLLHPIEFVRRLVLLNAACADRHAADRTFVERLHTLTEGCPPGVKAMLLAFDYYHDEAGRPVPEQSQFHIPNAYAAGAARRHPDRFEWIASIHPYRADALEALAAAVEAGTRAIKWLPNAMGIDPASPRCDGFYAALARHDVPLLTHGGEEAAVPSQDHQRLGNPLKLRRALDHGVRVIVAHCASLGSGVDLDDGPNGPPRSNFELFGRLMDEPRYRTRLFGDISAVTQRNRVRVAFPRLLERDDWHPRLLFGSDYPLPGVLPLISAGQFARAGWLAAADVPPLNEIRRHNPLLFDFVLKRRLRAGRHAFSAEVFRTRPFFAGRRT
jgi:predicted TIM-barrel fold metal-dependent hydrolase